jgi:hypothetical protein
MDCAVRGKIFNLSTIKAPALSKCKMDELKRWKKLSAELAVQCCNAWCPPLLMRYNGDLQCGYT